MFRVNVSNNRYLGMAKGTGTTFGSRHRRCRQSIRYRKGYTQLSPRISLKINNAYVISDRTTVGQVKNMCMMGETCCWYVPKSFWWRRWWKIKTRWPIGQLKPGLSTFPVGVSCKTRATKIVRSRVSPNVNQIKISNIFGIKVSVSQDCTHASLVAISPSDKRKRPSD